MNARSAIILFAHGARDPQWAQPFQRIQALVSQALPGIAVELAFLERMTPDLAEAVAGVVKASVTSVTIVPLFLGAGGHVNKDIVALVEEMGRRYAAVQFHVTAPIGEDDSVVAAIADWVVRKTG